MKRFIKYAGIVAFFVPVTALALVAPSVPSGLGNNFLTGTGVIGLIQQVVQYIMIASVTIAVGMFVYGGIRYAIGGADAGKEILWNATIGLVAILAVGLVVNTIAEIIYRGGFG